MENLAKRIRAAEIAANNHLTHKDMGKFVEAKKALQDAVKEYNQKWKSMQFEAFMAAEIPMIAAIEQLTIRELSIKETKNRDTGLIEAITVRTKTGDENIVDRDIDLAEFEDWATDNGYPRVGVNSQWRYAVEKFNHVMAVRAGLDMSGEAAAALIRNNYRLSEKAKGLSCGEPTSNKNAVALLQSIVDQIVFVDSGKKSKSGEPLNAIKVDERDLHFIKYLMCSRGAGLKVGLPKASTMKLLITKAINRNLKACEYTFDYDKVNSKESELPGFTAEESAAITSEEVAAA